MKYYLLKYSENYADEFDVEGVDILNENELKQFNDWSNKIKEELLPEIDIYFGTNECISMNVHDFLENLEIIEITPSFFSDFNNIFGFSFGNITPLNIIEQFLEYIEDE